MSKVFDVVQFLTGHPGIRNSDKGRELIRQLGLNHDHLTDRAYLEDIITSTEQQLLTDLETGNI